MFKSVKLGSLCLFAATSFAMAFGQSSIQGKMYGGQLPVAGAHIYLLSPAQSTSFGSASISLITPGSPNTYSDAIGTYVLTDGQGQFQINGQYTCTPNVPIYFYALSGNAGFGTNAAIANMAYLGVCGSINDQSYTIANEATTVALAYAVAGYATDPLHISYSGTPASLTGIQNAFANANNLANPSSGTANSTIPSGYATVPQATVNTIANALASCINETTQGTNTSNCATLFSATSVNGVAPTTTAAAAMNIAHNPASSTAANIQNGTNISSILELAQGYQQFTPFLTSAPNDLTLGLTFSNGGIASAFALAIDGSGNVWIANQPPSGSSGNGSVVEVANPTSMQLNDTTYPVVYCPLSGQPFSIAVDGRSQNVWIGTSGGVEEFSSTGAPAADSPFLTSNNYFGIGYALNLDNAGNVWVGANNSVFELSPNGLLLSPTPGYTLPAGAEPTALALDAANNVWITDAGNDDLIELNPQGLQVTIPGNSSAYFDLPNGVAIDASNSKWAANIGSNNFTKYASNGTPPFTYIAADTPIPFTITPQLTFVGIDGAGNSWFSLTGAFCSSSSVCFGVTEVSAAGTQLSGPGFAIDGFQPFGTVTANATAIDGAGNVWIANTYAQTVTELVGAAAPVVTPLVSAVSSNSLGARP